MGNFHVLFGSPSTEFLDLKTIKTLIKHAQIPSKQTIMIEWEVVAYLEVVEALHVPSDLVHLVVILFLDVTDGLRKFRLPEFAVLFGGITVGKGS